MSAAAETAWDTALAAGRPRGALRCLPREEDSVTAWSLQPCRDCGCLTSGTIAPGGAVHWDRCPRCVASAPPAPAAYCAECDLEPVDSGGRLCDLCLSGHVSRELGAATLGQTLLLMAVLVGLMLAIGAWL